MEKTKLLLVILVVDGWGGVGWWATDIHGGLTHGVPGKRGWRDYLQGKCGQVLINICSFE